MRALLHDQQLQQQCRLETNCLYVLHHRHLCVVMVTSCNCDDVVVLLQPFLAGDRDEMTISDHARLVSM